MEIFDEETSKQIKEEYQRDVDEAAKAIGETTPMANSQRRTRCSSLDALCCRRLSAQENQLFFILKYNTTHAAKQETSPAKCVLHEYLGSSCGVVASTVLRHNVCIVSHPS